MKIIFNENITALFLAFVSVFMNAISFNDNYSVTAETSYLLLSLLGCGVIALSCLRHIYCKLH